MVVPLFATGRIRRKSEKRVFEEENICRVFLVHHEEGKTTYSLIKMKREQSVNKGAAKDRELLGYQIVRLGL